MDNWNVIKTNMTEFAIRFQSPVRFARLFHSFKNCSIRPPALQIAFPCKFHFVVETSNQSPLFGFTFSQTMSGHHRSSYPD